MANVLAPFGFRLLGMAGEGSTTFGMITRKIASNNTEAIFKGDPVEDLATGYIQQWNATSVASRLVGIFRGCKYFSTAAQRVVWSNYWPGSDATGDVTAFLVPCVSNPIPKFVVQVATTALAFADIGTNHDVTIGTGNTVTGQSGATLTSASATTATLPFQMIGLWSDIGAPGTNGTDDTTNSNWVIVQANVTQITGI